MEMASGHPGFDVVNVGMHVQKRLVEKANWMEDLRPYIADKTLTTPDLDMADFSEASMKVATAADGSIGVLPQQPGSVHPVLQQGIVGCREGLQRRRRRPRTS